MAQSGAVVGLCPLTEANLGDGIFSLADYSALDGRWGVGSDANHLIDLTGELRIAEYGQRLSRERRDNVVGEGDTSVARVLFSRALEGGEQALGQPVGEISAGKRADLVELDPCDRARMGLFLAFQYPVVIPGVKVADFIRHAVTNVRGQYS